MGYQKYYPFIIEMILSSKFGKSKKQWARLLLDKYPDEIADQKTAEKIVLAAWRDEMNKAEGDFTKSKILQERKLHTGTDYYRPNPFFENAE